MAEQTFKSPGFFEREIEVISRPLTRNTATPVGVIGPAKKRQAFVPKTVTSVKLQNTKEKHPKNLYHFGNKGWLQLDSVDSRGSQHKR